MTAAEYADAALSDMQGSSIFTVSPERTRNVLVAAFRRAMLEERRECAKRAAVANNSGDHGDDIVRAIHKGPMP